MFFAVMEIIDFRGPFGFSKMESEQEAEGLSEYVSSEQEQYQLAPRGSSHRLGMLP